MVKEIIINTGILLSAGLMLFAMLSSIEYNKKLNKTTKKEKIK